MKKKDTCIKKIKSSSKMAIKETKKRIRCNPDIVFREEGKEALLFDPGSGAIKVLNFTGKMIWKLIGQGKTNKEIEDKLAKKFSDAKRTQICEDLGKFLGSLEKLGYIGKEI